MLAILEGEISRIARDVQGRVEHSHGTKLDDVCRSLEGRDSGIRLPKCTN